ncbi:DUF4870 domain-containing protein [Vulcaniibacterium tengchongense]|uniref:Tic20 family protein n=1 Tax=Vulcaniibacterium tengchongense TaxID=1273429 RepID=A0A3N4VIP8_9GAMM|nr:DUF4870 domain-containing protein [Vulcaniibacterium tengchongense]RPE76967.1 hypothetical protein EDC50_2219 [Vulcaniibacterium tengchongense]
MSENPVDPNQAVPPPPPPADAQPGGVPADQRQWAMFAHLSAIAGAILTSGVGGWGTFLGPLIIWLVKKDTMPFVDEQGKEALNFNITVALACVALVVLVVVTLGIGVLIAIPAWILIGIAWLVFTIIAAVKANDGVSYRYPFALRLVK